MIANDRKVSCQRDNCPHACMQAGALIKGSRAHIEEAWIHLDGMLEGCMGAMVCAIHLSSVGWRVCWALAAIDWIVDRVLAEAS